MHKTEFIPDNEIHNILLDSEIKTDHLSSTGRSMLMLIKKEKKNLLSNRFCRSGRSQRKIKENEKIDKYLDLARELKKVVEECVGHTNCW